MGFNPPHFNHAQFTFFPAEMLRIADLIMTPGENSSIILDEFDCDFDFLDLHGSEVHTRQSGRSLSLLLFAVVG